MAPLFRQISVLLCMRSYVGALMSALFCRALFWRGARTWLFSPHYTTAGGSPLKSSV